jgi:hypothetical protein
MPLQDITITGSIGSIATQSYGQRTYISSTDEQSFPIEHITGSDAKAWPNFSPGTNYTVDLVVNVTQSWSGSNVTSLGIVPYTHDTMEEFINGEFSGSNYIVSDGNLNDAQSEQFLTVGTTPTSYSMFPYSTGYTDAVFNSSTASLDLFLDRRTVPSNGQFLMHYNVYTYTEVPPTYNIKEIDYIKVARIDQEGKNNTLSLQELIQFIWTDNTAGEISLEVLNITEYPTYYLYKVRSRTWKDLIYYADDNVLNYAFSASSAAPMTASSNLFYLNNWNVINNSTGQFSGTFYTFALTPNCNIIYTASINIRNPNTSSVNFNFGFWSSNDFTSFNPIKTSSLQTLASGASTTVTLKDTSYDQFYGQTSYWLETRDNTLPLIITSASWLLTQSQDPQLFTSSIVIEPYLLSTFKNSDYDVLINNASENDISQTRQRVLYENGGTIPSNLSQIKAGIAEYAEINDYLYNAKANTTPRYTGVRTTSPDFNLPSQNGLTNEELANINNSSDLIINNGIPNVESTTTYFGYFTSLKANYPILKETTSPVLKYLIREDGEIFNPATDEATYYNMVGSFPRGSKAYTNLLFNTTTIFNSTQSILLSGESYTPILYTISASTPSIAAWTDKIDFESLDGGTFVGGNPPNYNLRVFGLPPTPLVIGSTYNALLTTTLTSYDSSSGWDPTPNNPIQPRYKFNNVPQTSVNILSQISVSFPANSIVNLFSIWNTTLWSTFDGIVSTSLATSGDQTISVPPWFNSPTNPFVTRKDFSLKKDNYFPTTGEYIYVTVTNKGPNNLNTAGGAGNIYNNLVISTNNAINPSIGSGIFWLTGSNNSTSITSSEALGQFILGNYRQKDIINSGFDPIESTCDIIVGDEIRFEYDENNTYRIIDIYPTSSISGSAIFYYTLDRIVPTSPSLNINHFTIRRKIKDYITGITLDSNLISQIDQGFLLPEYPSSDLKKNLPKIINDLSQKNII